MKSTTKTDFATTTSSSSLAAKAGRLQQILAGYRSTLVAFSGGVDSAYLAIAAQQAIGARRWR